MQVRRLSRIPWNTATSFALAGYLVVAVLLLESRFPSWRWSAVPGVLGALAAAYGTSTWLGALLARRARGLGACLAGGAAVGLTTLAAGFVALGLVNVFLLWLENTTSARWGLGPYTYASLAGALREFVLVPVYWALLLGGWIAVIFGLVYGGVLYVRAGAQEGDIPKRRGPRR